jgi:hypothetical protein
MEGIDVYFLAKQMGTSVKMIEKHYGHITPSKNAERILHGIPGWEPIAEASPGAALDSVNAGGAETKAKAPTKKVKADLPDRSFKRRDRRSGPEDLKRTPLKRD